VLSVDLDRNRIALSLKREAGKPAEVLRPKAPPAPKVHKPGDIAPNGMRFR
jgi:ribosomal protein S1